MKMDPSHVACMYCLKEQSALFIKCTDCKSVTLCLRYPSSSKLANLFPPWLAGEELQLLDALEQYGLGNWEDIAAKLDCDKEALECRNHYCNYYLDGFLSHDALSAIASGSLSDNNNDENDGPKPSNQPRITDHTESHHYPSTSTSTSNASVLVEIEDQQLLGYMPARGDFERDYDNDAESILCRLHPSFSHDDLEDELKVAQVDIYNHRLRERQRRKEISREHDLIGPILAFILNKRLKRQSSSGGARPSNANGQSRRSRRSSPVGRHSQQPAPGTWLAAPFIRLQASGAGRGKPLLVAASLPSRLRQRLPPTASNDDQAKLVRRRQPELALTTSWNSFHLHEKVKPFLRYFSGAHGKQFMSNLYREEALKHEITVLSNRRNSGQTGLNGTKTELFTFPSQVYQQHNDNGNSCPIPGWLASARFRTGQRANRQLAANGGRGGNRQKKRRRFGATPWYARVVRRKR